MERPSSVILGRDPEVLDLMLRFYGPANPKILDVTANARRMWKGLRGWDVTYMDLDPQMSPDIIGDFRDIPQPPESWDILVFDPPHLPVAAASNRSMQRFATDYGLRHAPRAHNISPTSSPSLGRLPVFFGLMDSYSLS